MGLSYDWLTKGEGSMRIEQESFSAPTSPVIEGDPALEEQVQTLKALLWDKDQEIRALKKSIAKNEKLGERNHGHDPSVDPA